MGNHSAAFGHALGNGVGPYGLLVNAPMPRSMFQVCSGDVDLPFPDPTAGHGISILKMCHDIGLLRPLCLVLKLARKDLKM